MWKHVENVPKDFGIGKKSCLGTESFRDLLCCNLEPAPVTHLLLLKSCKMFSQLIFLGETRFDQNGISWIFVSFVSWFSFYPDSLQIPNLEIDKNENKFFTSWDPQRKVFTMQAGCQQRDEMEMICLYLCRKEVENLHKNYKSLGPHTVDSRFHDLLDRRTSGIVFDDESIRQTERLRTIWHFLSLITYHFIKSWFHDAIYFFWIRVAHGLQIFFKDREEKELPAVGWERTMHARETRDTWCSDAWKTKDTRKDSKERPNTWQLKIAKISLAFWQMHQFQSVPGNMFVNSKWSVTRLCHKDQARRTWPFMASSLVPNLHFKIRY